MRFRVSSISTFLAQFRQASCTDTESRRTC
jgi:hypothetical protein